MIRGPTLATTSDGVTLASLSIYTRGLARRRYPMVRWLAAFAFMFILSMASAPVSNTALAQGGVPDKTGKTSHSVSRRRHQRRAGPHRRREVAGEVGSAGHRREPHRRRRQHRCRDGVAGGARWLHPAGVGNAADRHQPEPLQAVELQGGRICADHEFRIGAQSRHRAQRAAGEFRQRIDRVREGQPRQARLWQPGAPATRPT